MELDAKTKARIAALHKEIDAIHYANAFFWKQDVQATVAKAEYQFRHERLEKIRAELAELQSSFSATR